MTPDPLDLDAIEAYANADIGVNLYQQIMDGRKYAKALLARVRELEAENARLNVELDETKLAKTKATDRHATARELLSAIEAFSLSDADD